MRTKLRAFTQLPWRKKLSILKRGKPNNAKIEICGTCNLACVMCLRTSLEHRDRIMSPSEFRIILDHLPDLLYWSPHGYNEPLLHPLFLYFVEEAHNRGLSLNLVTNGTLLTPPVVEQLKKFRILKIVVSLEGVGERYEEIRRGGNWDQLLANLAYLAKENLPVVLHATIWKDNLDQIPELVKLAYKFDFGLGVNDITWKNEYGSATKRNSIRENIPYSEVEQLIYDYNHFSRVSIDLWHKDKRSCSLPWNSVYVDVIGDVYPCTDNLDYRVGNLFQYPISDIYHNARYERFRAQSRTGERETCRTCLSWGPQK